MNAVYFDLETCDADQLYLRRDFVRLAAYAVDDGPVQLTTDFHSLVGVLSSADVVVAHNGVAFDLAALHKWHGLDVQKLVDEGRIRDTLLMARQSFPPEAPGSPKKYDLDSLAVHLGVSGKLKSDGTSVLRDLAKEFGGFDKIPVKNETYRAYARADVEALRAVAKALPPADDYVLRECRYLWRLTAMTRYGCRVDPDEMERQVQRAATEKRRCLELLHRKYGTPSPDSSASPLATSAGKARVTEVLTGFGVEVSRGRDGMAKTGKAELDAYMESDPEHDALQEFCHAVKTANGQRTPPQKYVRSDGRFHPGVSAHQRTGRLSITNPGLTIMGKRDEKNALDRAVVLPDADDEVLLCVDLSQVDARAVAAYVQDENYLSMFEPGKDQHKEMAKMIYGDESRRSEAKMFTHAINYGMGARSLAEKSGKGESEVQALLSRVDAQFPRIGVVRKWLRNTATGIVVTPYGRRIGFNPQKAHTQALASIGQATARDLLADGILRLPSEIAQRLRVLVHDEIVLSVPRESFEQFREDVLHALQFDFIARAGAKPVAILAEASGPGEDWADTYADEHPEWPGMRRSNRVALHGGS